MTRLNDEQKKHFKDKAEFENNVKITTEMAREKVYQLEQELKRQNDFFDKHKH
jgi:hypothetical protein